MQWCGVTSRSQADVSHLTAVLLMPAGISQPQLKKNKSSLLLRIDFFFFFFSPLSGSIPGKA